VGYEMCIRDIYITQAYCGKDMKNDVEDLYGKNKKRGYVDQVIRREDYLKEVGKSLSLNLGFNLGEEIKIVSIFLSYTIHFFQKYPPIKTEILFFNFKEFNNYLKKD
jgi:hypothetical protein